MARPLSACRALAAATKVRALSMMLCYHMALSKADVDSILVRTAALEQLKMSKMDSWSEWGAGWSGLFAALGLG